MSIGIFNLLIYAVSLLIKSCVCVCRGGYIITFTLYVRVQSRFCVMCLSWGSVHTFTFPTFSDSVLANTTHDH